MFQSKGSVGFDAEGIGKNNGFLGGCSNLNAFTFCSVFIESGILRNFFSREERSMLRERFRELGWLY